ncbi:MAG: dTDP-4-dehydrorhamnose 3,5-epimerase [Gammaproteobacteria bacterium]|nr:dTDP-4-dehydrorhamnose 3,5-epimerase [Gammaproteobacteria bacterium]
MKVIPSSIPDVLIIEPDLFGDERGFFMETWHAEKFSAHGIALPFVQDNHSRSQHGVLRGLHYQLTRPQGKLVRVVSGAVYDVAVDIRRGSATYGQWVGVELSQENNRQMYVPPGFAHGFCVLSEYADFLYKCTDFYAPDDEQGIIWNDPDIGIEWPDFQFVVSHKDATNRSLKELAELDLLPTL